MNEIVFKELKLNIDLKTCYISNKEIKLTKSEYNILELFLKNTNKVFSRKEILEKIGNLKVSLRTIDTIISRLRKKLGNLSKYIITRLGFGYGINSTI